MNVSHLFAGLIACLAIVGCKPNTSLRLSETAAQTTASLKEKIPELMHEFSVPGMTVAVVRDGKVEIINSFGTADATNQRPIDSETVFEVASLGKPVCAYMTIKLAEEGKFNLDLPLVNYVPDLFASTDPRLKAITARMILSHSSGLPNFGNGPSEMLLFDPGSEFSYSGIGFEKLQLVLERVAGRPLNALAKELVFEPFGMTSTSYVWRDDFESRFAFGNDKNGNQMDLSRRPHNAHAAWSLYSTSKDYANFVARLLDTSNSVASEMFSAQIAVTEEIVWGLGWGLQSTEPNRSFWHWGSNPGYRAYVVGYPVEGIAVVVLSNSESLFKLIEKTVKVTIGGDLPSFHWF